MLVSHVLPKVIRKHFIVYIETCHIKNKETECPQLFANPIENPPFLTSPILTRGSLAKKKIMFLHSKNKASRKGYKGEC